MDELTALFVAGRDGDRPALAAGVRGVHRDVWRLCAGLVEPSEADDLTEATFVQAFRAASGLGAESSSWSWLLSIARRVCADAIPSRQRLRRFRQRLVTRTEVSIGSVVEVDDLLPALDEGRRAALVLTQLMGLSYAEAATVSSGLLGSPSGRTA